MGARRTGRISATALAGVLVASTWAACEPPPTNPDIYQYAGRCYVLKDATTGRFVARDAFGYRADVAQSAATPFSMQATALGRYLFYGPDRQMPRTDALNGVLATAQPGRTADWRIRSSNGRHSFTNLNSLRGLSVNSAGRLGQSTAIEARWALVAATGCTAFPEITVNATGTPFRGTSPTAPVRGFLDAHTHISAFQFLGGRFHCGRPWSPYGVTVALQDCADHHPNHAAAAAENFLSGTPTGGHSTDGWPSFAGWPKPHSLTHEGTYWKWLERAWRGGLRILVNDLVQNRALCEIYPLKDEVCNDMDSVRKQAGYMYQLQDYIDAQFRGPGKGFFRIVRSPSEARRVINEGKLAVVLGVEVSEVLDCGLDGDETQCDQAKVDAGLDDLWDLGVRSLFPIHKFDNAFGGTAFDSGTTGVLVNLGNKYATGRWWQAQSCAPGAEADRSPMNLSGNQAALYAIFGQGIAPLLLGGDLPSYPPGPLCNPRGLTTLGRYVVNAMADRGMIVETDHMSVKARSEALAILRQRQYPGVISSHSWGDHTSQVDLQGMGGVVAPYANTTPEYAESWLHARHDVEPGTFFGIGYGSDTNGLGSQPDPRPGAVTDRPVTYPYTTFDGGTVMDKQRSGTRVYDVNVDGVPHYGLFPDYVEDLRQIAGDPIVEDMARGAEAYLEMWEAATAAATG